MSDPVEFLDLEDLLELAGVLLSRGGLAFGVTSSRPAAARPQTTMFGEDAYATIFDKAAALFKSLVKNHPLVDGNERLGWLATAVFLDLNGVNVEHVSNDTVYDLVIEVAAGSLDVEQTSQALRGLVD